MAMNCIRGGSRSTAVTCVKSMAKWHNSGKSDDGSSVSVSQVSSNNTNVRFGDFLP